MDWLSFAGSIIGGIIGGLFTFLGVKITLRHDDVTKHQEKLKKAHEDRPRLTIVNFKEISKPTAKKSDLDVICLEIKGIKQGFRNIEFIYDKKALNEDNLVCCEYTFKNIGKTEIDSICMISNSPKTMSLISLSSLNLYIHEKLLNYDVWSNKRFIKQGEEFNVRVFFVENQVFSSCFSASIGIYIQDINGRYWHQPLFVPQNETDNSTLTSRKELKAYTNVEAAIECFEGKGYW